MAGKNNNERRKRSLKGTTTTEIARTTNVVVFCRKTSFLVPLNQPVNSLMMEAAFILKQHFFTICSECYRSYGFVLGVDMCVFGRFERRCTWWRWTARRGGRRWVSSLITFFQSSSLLLWLLPSETIPQAISILECVTKTTKQATLE